MITHDFCHFSLDMTKHHSVGIRDRYTKLLRTGTWFIKYGRKTCIVTAFIQLLETTRPSRSWTNFVKCPELTFEIFLSALSAVVMMRCSGNCSGRLSEYLLSDILLRLTACTIMKWCGKGQVWARIAAGEIFTCTVWWTGQVWARTKDKLDYPQVCDRRVAVTRQEHLHMCS